MLVTDIPVERLVPYARNPRNNAKAIDAVKASIAEFGFRQPIVVDENMIVIVGHTRLEAAKALGLTMVPVHVAEGLTPAQARAYRLMDNRSHENAEWDDELLKLEFGDLKLDGFDLDLTGFDADQLSELLSGDSLEGLTDPDEAPAVPEQACSRPGDLWVLGDHRVLCGDATALADVERLMGGMLADMAFTDPPYNVDYGGKGGEKSPGKGRQILNDALGDAFAKFLGAACTNLLTVTKGACYVCMSSSELHTPQRAWLDAGGKWSTFVIWAKNTFTLGRADYQRQYEPILYGWKVGSEHFWCGARDQGDVWHHDNASPLGLLGGRGFNSGGVLLDAERVVGGRVGVKGERAFLVVAAPDRLVALGADLLEQSLGDQTGEHLGHGAALQFGGERIDGAVGPLAGLAEDDELGVGELGHGRLLQGLERPATIASLLRPRAPRAGGAGAGGRRCVASVGEFALVEGAVGDALE